MIEVVADNGRVWLTINGQRIGMLVSQARELARALQSAANQIDAPIDAEFQAGEV